jgi:hypothetical protein
MEELARDLGGANCCDRAKFRFRVFDRFGTMYGFHVRGREKFQTKVGSVMTLGWLALIALIFIYYGAKLLDKTEPLMQTNSYRSDFYPNLDLQDENFQFYWTSRNLISGAMIEWDFWWENFSMYATMMTILTNGNYAWQNIPIVNCETQDWWSKNHDSKSRSQFTDIYFCLDLPKG